MYCKVIEGRESEFVKSRTYKRERTRRDREWWSALGLCIHCGKAPAAPVNGDRSVETRLPALSRTSSIWLRRVGHRYNHRRTQAFIYPVSKGESGWGLVHRAALLIASAASGLFRLASGSRVGLTLHFLASEEGDC